MHINVILILFVVFLGLLLGMKDNRLNRKLYIILCSAVLLFVAAMRSPEYMMYMYRLDTLNYKGYFDLYREMSWYEFWHYVVFSSSLFYNGFDIGFIGFNKILGLLTSDFHIYSLLADLLFFVPFGVILYRYCTSMRQIVFAFVFYIALVQVYLIGGARQIFAIGFDLMALLAIMDKKKIWTIVFFLLGASIHLTSFLFLIPLLMIWFDIKPKTLRVMHIVCFFILPIALLIPNEIVAFMGDTVGIEKYAEYGKGSVQGGATTFIVLIELLSLFCLLALNRKEVESNEALRHLYVMAPLFTIFAPLIRANGAMTRIALYYYLFLALLVPFGLDNLFRGRHDRIIVYIVAIGALAFLSISGGGMTYYFYWQY